MLLLRIYKCKVYRQKDGKTDRMKLIAVTLSCCQALKCEHIKHICAILIILEAAVRVTRGMLLLTKAKRPLKFKILCGFNKHAVKLRMHKAAPYAFPIPLNTF